MKRWEDFLKEEPSKELTAATEQRILPELKALSPTRRGWMQWAAVALGLSAVIGGYRLTRQEDGPEGAALLELADDTDLDLEAIEDLDVIDILEELEEWTA